MADITSPRSGIEPIFISVKEAAQALSISTWQVYQLLDDNPERLAPIESRYHGRRRLVSVASLRAYAEGLPTARPEADAS